jgi:hypothetical protein
LIKVLRGCITVILKRDRKVENASHDTTNWETRASLGAGKPWRRAARIKQLTNRSATPFLTPELNRTEIRDDR